MFRKRFIAAVGTVAAAGALALGAGTAAFAVNPPNVPVSVTVTPNHFSVNAGQAVSPALAVTDDLNQWLIDHGAVETLSVTGLPAGVTLASATGPTTIGGTPAASADGTSGTAVVTATAVESPDTHIRDLGPHGLNFPGCSYSIKGPLTDPISAGADEDATADSNQATADAAKVTADAAKVTADAADPDYSEGASEFPAEGDTGDAAAAAADAAAATADSAAATADVADATADAANGESNAEDSEAASDTVSNVKINATSGAITYSLTDTSENSMINNIPTSLSALNSLTDATYVVTKTCVATADVSWSVGAAGQTVTVTAPPTTTITGVPSGGVQTGGGLPVHHSNNGLWYLMILPFAAILGYGYKIKWAEYRAGKV